MNKQITRSVLVALSTFELVGCLAIATKEYNGTYELVGYNTNGNYTFSSEGELTVKDDSISFTVTDTNLDEQLTISKKEINTVDEGIIIKLSDDNISTTEIHFTTFDNGLILIDALQGNDTYYTFMNDKEKYDDYVGSFHTYTDKYTDKELKEQIKNTLDNEFLNSDKDWTDLDEFRNINITDCTKEGRYEKITGTVECYYKDEYTFTMTYEIRLWDDGTLSFFNF